MPRSKRGYLHGYICYFRKQKYYYGELLVMDCVISFLFHAGVGLFQFSNSPGSRASCEDGALAWVAWPWRQLCAAFWQQGALCLDLNKPSPLYPLTSVR